ncbi:hypothetical protein AY599_21725, partial [Leptolyngbya valderiana BDU 20041]
TQAGFDFGIATNGNDIIDFAQLPSSEIAQLQGSPSTDAIVLLGGNDIAVDDAAGRIYFGNAGDDVINGGGGADTLAGGQNNDRLEGGTENDLLFGNLGGDNLLGGDGDDTILGGQDNDILLGEGGNDVLGGERGFDTLTGGTGSDQFILASSGVQGTDVVTDFQDGVDKVRLPDGVSFANLQIQASSTSTLIFLNGAQLMTLSNVASSLIGSDDFVGGSSTPPPSGDPGNSPGDALNLGVLTGTQILNDFVGSVDRNDFYRFEVTQPSDINYLIDGLSDTIDSQIILDRNNNGEVDSGESISDTWSSSSSISNDITLGVGTYFLRIFTPGDRDNTSYSLTLSQEARNITTPSDPGNNLNTALNLGVLGGDLLLNDFSGSVDRDDFYRFELVETSDVSYFVDGLSDTIDSQIIFDSNNNGEVDSGESISDTWSSSSSISNDITLGAGTYFLRIFTPGDRDNTAYSLRLSV